MFRNINAAMFEPHLYAYPEHFTFVGRATLEHAIWLANAT